jgi:hypothetical protein
MDRIERAIRNYALHLGLILRRRGSVLALYERYDQKRKLGEYRRWAPSGARLSDTATSGCARGASGSDDSAAYCRDAVAAMGALLSMSLVDVMGATQLPRKRNLR